MATTYGMMGMEDDAYMRQRAEYERRIYDQQMMMGGMQPIAASAPQAAKEPSVNKKVLLCK